MKPGLRHETEDCRAVSDILGRVGDKWTVLVVGFLSSGPMRFSELRRSIGGISQKMLTTTLRGLERDGFVTRTVFPSIPPRVDYELTDLGHELRVPVNALGEWARLNMARVKQARERFDNAPSEQSTPVARTAARQATR
ncbi:transcriptional regulator, HxlR family [Mesorhizobium albiziae]|uniref:Transcriptional regulator, HxlR family n=1 Tax=Neomesorhizobium albiziae TaxID=335020 RepID=A0A1I3ZEX8_9HYPH|nr:helix-turn-helix domain-containing protein [Mesorhizobium albiziae]GLS32181.1 HxlR family transcriptional regulator [Mesorhizobium albiziae]SFK42694.1 transcriptional regulator, HxlR family [Mesorhizobium albiziae]